MKIYQEHQEEDVFIVEKEISKLADAEPDKIVHICYHDEEKVRPCKRLRTGLQTLSGAAIK